jgi:hypothetical protein
LELLEAYYREYQLLNCVGISLDDAREEMLRDLADESIWHLEASNRKKQLFVYTAQKDVTILLIVACLIVVTERSSNDVQNVWNIQSTSEQSV